MDPDRSVQIAVGGAHDGRSGASGRKAGDKDALGIDRIVLHDLAGDARDQRGLAFVALLVGRCETSSSISTDWRRCVAPDRPPGSSVLLR